MTYDIFAEIAELRAELTHCFLTKRERTDALKRIAVLTARAKETEA